MQYRSPFVLAFVILLVMSIGCTSISPTSPGDDDLTFKPEGMKENSNGILSSEASFPRATIALNPPTGLTADISGYIPDVAESSGRVTLTWIDNSISEVGFLIERKVDDGLWVLYGQVDAGAVTYSDLDIEVDKTFSYRVQAASANHRSDYSNEASVFTGIATFNPKPSI